MGKFSTVTCLEEAQENQIVSNLISRTKKEAGKGKYFTARAIS